MSVVDKLQYLNSADGPNIPMRTLAVYCGISAASVCNYINGKQKMDKEMERQIEKGLRELAKEIWREICRNS